MVSEMLSPQDLIESYEGRAGLLARCILYGLVEPDVEIDANVLATLSSTLVSELATTLEETPTRFVGRAQKAYAWALRFQPEFAVMFAIQLNQLIVRQDQTVVDEILEMPEYNEFLNRFREFIFPPTGDR